MARFGFVGPTYTSQSRIADAEMSMNFYPEIMESQGSLSAMALYPTPGIAGFANLGAGPVLDLKEANGRLFALGNGAIWEVASNGTLTNRGAVSTASATFGTIAVGNFYLLITCNGHAYSLKLADNTFTDVTARLAQANPWLAFFVDGYFGAVFQGGTEFQISALEDPATWSGTDVAQVSVFPENITGCLVDHREIWFWSNKHAQVYYNSGNASFPLAVIPGGFCEQGLVATASPVRMDNSVFWLGSDERGMGIAWRANGYVPVRVSNHAVEYSWSQYSTVSDAIGYSYQEDGHTFWVLYFPSADATWVYDAATGQWHQRGYGAVPPVYNGNFEKGTALPPAGWIDNGTHTLAWETTNPYSGAQSLEITAGQYGSVIQEGFPVSAGATVNVSCYAKADGLGGVANLLISWRNASGSEIGAVETSLSSTSWSKLSLNVVAPANAVTFNIYLRQKGAGAFTVWFDEVSLNFSGHYGRCFAHAFGYNLIGSRSDGNIYSMSINNANDLGLPIWRVRRAPAISTEMAWILHRQMTLQMETGTGLPSDGNPQAYLRWSDDGCETWSNTYSQPIGPAGLFGKRVVWRRLGHARTRVYELRTGTTVPVRISDAYLDADPGFNPVPRLSKYFGGMQ